jgi:hypothetical protein
MNTRQKYYVLTPEQDAIMPNDMVWENDRGYLRRFEESPEFLLCGMPVPAGRLVLRPVRQHNHRRRGFVPWMLEHLHRA